MIFAAFNDGLYKVLFLGHMLAFVAAFAPAVIHPLLGAQSKGDDPAARFRLAGYMAANGRRLHLPALVALGLFGIAMVVVADGFFAFDQAWVWLSTLVWLAIGGVLSAIVVPGERALAAGDESAEAAVARGGAISTVLLLVVLYLMIWKPGL